MSWSGVHRVQTAIAVEMAEHTFKDSITTTIVNFLVDIGLGVRSGRISGQTFLPGIMIEQGTLRIDEAQLKYPGDLLHEAGHLALRQVHLGRWRGEARPPGARAR